MRILLLLLTVFVVFRAGAQSYSHVQDAGSNPFLSDVNGRPLYLPTNYNAEGSPYFLDDYRPARIVLADGSVYSDIRVKFNLVERLVQYLDKNGKEMVTDKPVRQLTLLNPEEGKEYVLESDGPALNSNNAVVYQLLDSGAVRLLKKITVTSRDEKPYSSASITRVYDRKEILYYQNSGEHPAKLERNKSFVSGLFKTRQAEIIAFAESNQINFKDEQDLKRIFQLANARQGKN